jgi:hypothetical protein
MNLSIDLDNIEVRNRNHVLIFTGLFFIIFL